MDQVLQVGMTSLAARSKLASVKFLKDLGGRGCVGKTVLCRVKIITLKYDSAMGRIDDSSLVEFIIVVVHNT